jgi:mono/diheme cytochrome c family protein
MRALVAVLFGAALSAQQAAGPTAPAGPVPTYNKDVGPILHQRCATCHRPGEAGPMPLLTYTDARPYAAAIRAVTRARLMPPWFADPRFGAFKNAHVLTETQVATLAAWVEGGAPEGEGVAPAPPAFKDGWSGRMDRPPDLVVELPAEFEVPATGIVPVFTLWVKLPIRDERFVEAMEIRPDNRRIVHHSSASAAPLPPGTRLGRAAPWDGGPEMDGVPLFRDGKPFRAAGAESFGKPLLFYVPAGGFQQYPNGLAKRVSADQHLAWGVHLMTTGKPEKTKIRLGLWFRRSAHHEMYTWTVNERRIVEGQDVAPGARPPNIPAGAANWAMTGQLRFKDDVTLYALWPHMHYRGKDMTFVLTRPDGKEETLLSVPRYNPNWQFTYELATPLKIKARSVLTAYAHYDNSAANRYNPAPTEEVVFGEQGHNEMFIPFIEVTVDNEDLRFERMRQQ